MAKIQASVSSIHGNDTGVSVKYTWQRYRRQCQVYMSKIQASVLSVDGQWAGLQARGMLGGLYRVPRFFIRDLDRSHALTDAHTLAFREPTLNLTAAPPHSARARTPEPHRLREVSTLDPAPKRGPGKTDHIQDVFGSQD